MADSLQRPDSSPSPRRAGLVSREKIRELFDLSRSGGVVYVDIDRFHRVNQTWGQHIGDAALAAIAARILAVVPPEASVASTDGDAFVIALPDAGGPWTQVVAEGLIGTIGEPLVIDGIRLMLGASAGYACYEAGESSDELLEQAFLACRRAKTTLPGSALGYEMAIGAHVIRRQRTEDGLRRGIAAGELRLHLQPTIDLRDGRVVGVEALVRWQHPTDGLLLPGDFLPIAEAAGLMTLIGDWVLEEAIAIVVRWRSTPGAQSMRIWVNLAAQQLVNGDSLYERVRAAMGAGRINAHDIGFEVTESSLLADLPSAVGSLSALRALGMEIALDDFGTGYSSLTYLRQLPVSAVKIDRSFVAGIGGSLADEAIVEAVIDLAHALGMRVIAEGIEDNAQASALIRMGADEAQGFHFGRPAPPELVEPFLGLAWCGAEPPTSAGTLDVDRRADDLPGFGSARARLLLAALDTVHDSIIVTAASGGHGLSPAIVYVNPAFEAETGFLSRDVVGQTMSHLLADSEDAEQLGWFRSVHAGTLAATSEVANRRSDGSLFLCEVTVSPILDERGTHTHWLHVRRDLTQRRAVESEGARFQGLIEQSSSLVAMSETGGRWVYANAAMRQALGIAMDAPLDDLAGRLYSTAGQRRTITNEVLPALQRDGAWCGPGAIRNGSTGEVTEVVTDVRVLVDLARPGINIFAAVSRDVTEVNAVERGDLRRRRLADFAADTARRALDQEPGAFVDADEILAELGELLDADIAYIDAIDLDEGQLEPLGGWMSSRCVRRTRPPRSVGIEQLPHWIERLQRPGLLISDPAFEGNAPWREELARVFPGEWFGVDISAPLHVGGTLVGVLGVSSLDAARLWSDDELATIQQVADAIANLLGRHRSDRARQLSEGRAKTMLGNVRDIVVVVDRGGWIRWANDAVVNWLGLNEADVVGLHVLDLVHVDDRNFALDRLIQTIDRSAVFPITELRLLHVDGSWNWFDVDTSGVEDELLGGLVLSLRNVTMRHSVAQQAMDRSDLERMVLELSRWALAVDEDDIASGLVDQLGNVARALGAHAAGSWRVEGDVVGSASIWTIGAFGERLVKEHLPVPAMVEHVRTTDALVVEDIMLHDAAWADEWRRVAPRARSAILVPLVAPDGSIGVVSVSMCDVCRVWTADEVSIVRRVAETVFALLARQRVEASLRCSESRLAALLGGSLDVVLVIDDDGRIVYANGAVERGLGYRLDEVVDLTILDVAHVDDRDRLADALRHPDPRSPVESMTTRLVARDGTVRWWEIVCGTARDATSGGQVLTCRDITDRRAEELSATARVDHLRYAFNVAQTALDLDAEEFLDQLTGICATVASMLRVDLVYVDQIDQSREMLTNLAGHGGNGAVLRVGPGRSLPFSAVPLWVERLRQTEPIVITEARDCDEPWALEKRTALGSEGGLMAMAMSSAGELFGVLGVSMLSEPRHWSDDELTFVRILAETVAHVLERAKVDAALRSSETRFRLLSETAADVVLLADASGLIAYASPSSKALLGFTPDDLLGRQALSLIHPDDIGSLTNAGRTMLSGLPLTTECRLLRTDGSVVWVANSISAVLDPGTGQALEFRASVRDITDRKRLQAALEQQALHDPLTGLANRVLLQSRLIAAAAAGDRDDIELAVLLIDLDGFKTVNDTFGHAVGDDVLRIVAQRLAALARHQDTLARTGGDEFVVVCPGASAATAMAIGERIVHAVSRPLSTNGMIVTLGASIGVAHHMVACDQFDGIQGARIDPGWMLIEADHAMYAAKREGRGRVRLASGQHAAAVGAARSSLTA